MYECTNNVQKMQTSWRASCGCSRDPWLSRHHFTATADAVQRLASAASLPAAAGVLQKREKEKRRGALGEGKPI